MEDTRFSLESCIQYYCYYYYLIMIIINGTNRHYDSLTHTDRVGCETPAECLCSFVRDSPQLILEICWPCARTALRSNWLWRRIVERKMRRVGSIGCVRVYTHTHTQKDTFSLCECLTRSLVHSFTFSFCVLAEQVSLVVENESEKNLTQQ